MFQYFDVIHSVYAFVISNASARTASLLFVTFCHVIFAVILGMKGGEALLFYTHKDCLPWGYLVEGGRVLGLVM